MESFGAFYRAPLATQLQRFILSGTFRYRKMTNSFRVAENRCLIACLSTARELHSYIVWRGRSVSAKKGQQGRVNDNNTNKPNQNQVGAAIHTAAAVELSIAIN